MDRNIGFRPHLDRFILLLCGIPSFLLILESISHQNKICLIHLCLSLLFFYSNIFYFCFCFPYPSRISYNHGESIYIKITSKLSLVVLSDTIAISRFDRWLRRLDTCVWRTSNIFTEIVHPSIFLLYLSHSDEHPIRSERI